MSTEDLIRTILLRPTVSLSPTDKNTGVEATYSQTPLSNLYFMRGQAIVTPAGIVMGRMNSQQRADEVELVRYCLSHLGIHPIYCVTGEDAYMEGDDYLAFGTVSVIGDGLRTNMAAIQQLMAANCLGHDTVVVVHDKMRIQKQMALDTYFNIIDKDLVTLCANRYDAKEGDEAYLSCDIYVKQAGEQNEQTGNYGLVASGLGYREWLESRGVEIIRISDEDAAHYANTYLTIAPRHIVAIQGQSIDLGNQLRKHDVMVDWVDASTLVKGYGGIRQLTQVLQRK